MSDLEKPIMSAIPTADEMWKAFEEGRARRGVFLDGIQTIHALVASRVVELDCTLCKADFSPKLGPIKAIVEILEIVAAICAVRPKHEADAVRVIEKLTALKRSLEPGSGE
jgi:hypothetical protein